MFCYLRHTAQRLFNFLAHFEFEGDGYNTNGEYAHLLGYLGHNRCRTGSCTTTHTGRDECHLGAVVKEPLYLFAALLGGHMCYGRVVSRTKSLGHGLSKLHLHRNVRVVQCLYVGIAYNK